MIRKLRIRFILAAMISLILVMTVIMTTIGILNYHNIMTRADQQLQILVDNNGTFPQKLGSTNRDFSPEMPFDTRYFFVSFDQDQQVQSMNTGKIASISNQQAITYANKALLANNTKGTIDTYRYFIYTDQSNTIHVCFLSCHRELSSFQNFLFNSILVSVIGYIAVLLLLIVTSNKIIKPVSESYEKQKRFITDAGHELKTPLTIISADTEVLEMDYGKNEWLSDIRKETSRLANLTNNLIFLSRMEEQPQMEKHVFSLSNVVKESVDDFKAVAKSQDKTFHAFIENDFMLCGDEVNIRRLLSILLENAVKYTDDHGYITVKLEQVHGQYRLQIINTTTHIDKSSLPHLFDRFYRTDKSRNTKTGGYGLGLSIALAIVNAHHGKITATTTDEKSLCMSVILPKTFS